MGPNPSDPKRQRPSSRAENGDEMHCAQREQGSPAVAGIGRPSHGGLACRALPISAARRTPSRPDPDPETRNSDDAAPGPRRSHPRPLDIPGGVSPETAEAADSSEKALGRATSHDGCYRHCVRERCSIAQQRDPETGAYPRHPVIQARRRGRDGIVLSWNGRVHCRVLRNVGVGDARDKSQGRTAAREGVAAPRGAC